MTLRREGHISRSLLGKRTEDGQSPTLLTSRAETGADEIFQKGVWGPHHGHIGQDGGGDHGKPARSRSWKVLGRTLVTSLEQGGQID